MEKIICFVEPPRCYSGERWANQGTVLLAQGKAVTFEKSQQGRELSDWIVTDRTPENYTGALVWEGECQNLWAMHHTGDWEPHLVGQWRLPTGEELQSLVGDLQSA
jgi:hypothetical protein